MAGMHILKKQRRGEDVVSFISRGFFVAPGKVCPGSVSFNHRGNASWLSAQDLPSPDATGTQARTRTLLLRSSCVNQKRIPLLAFMVQVLAAVFLTVLPAVLHAQSVTFSSAQTTVPVTGLNAPWPWGVAVDGAGNVFIPQGYQVLEVNTVSVNFPALNICAPGQTTMAACNRTITLNYNVTAGGTLGTPIVLTQGAPNLDFTLAGGSTCTGAVTAGSTCTVNATFAPTFSGQRAGVVQIVDGSGNVLAATLVYGLGQGPEMDFTRPSRWRWAPAFLLRPVWRWMERAMSSSPTAATTL